MRRQQTTARCTHDPKPRAGAFSPILSRGGLTER